MRASRAGELLHFVEWVKSTYNDKVTSNNYYIYHNIYIDIFNLNNNNKQKNKY